MNHVAQSTIATSDQSISLLNQSSALLDNPPYLAVFFCSSSESEDSESRLFRSVSAMFFLNKKILNSPKYNWNGSETQI